MALVHVTAIRNAIADLVVDQIDIGAGANGTLELWTSSDAEVATLAFGATAFGAAASGTATANAITQDSSATGGIVAKFVIKDSDAAEVLRGTVTATGGGGDLTMPSVTVTATEPVTCSSLTYSAPA